MSEQRRKWLKNNDTPPPGSDTAQEQGCKCPVMDNSHGEGGYMGGYFISEKCPIHNATGGEER